MLFIVFTLVFSVTLVLTFVSFLHPFSPYNKITARSLGTFEQVLLYFITIYPFLSLVLLLSLPGNIILYLSSDATYHRSYYIFCVAHVLLSIITAAISFSMRRQSQFFSAFFAFSALAGGGYLTAVIAALAESTRH